MYGVYFWTLFCPTNICLSYQYMSVLLPIPHCLGLDDCSLKSWNQVVWILWGFLFVCLFAWFFKIGYCRSFAFPGKFYNQLVDPCFASVYFSFHFCQFSLCVFQNPVIGHIPTCSCYFSGWTDYFTIIKRPSSSPVTLLILKPNPGATPAFLCSFT